jgi:NO-binding membrane sensor protein with MHYT domain
VVDVNHFTHGWINPVLAYAVSFLGSVLGLICAARARDARPAGRHAGWLALAAVALGGTAVWLAHFLALLGFTVVDGPVRYNVPLTAASVAAAVVFVGVGLFVFGYGEPSRLKLVAGGLSSGLGIAAGHYIGMAAVRVHGTLAHSVPYLLASVIVAVIAATTILWLTQVVGTLPVIAGAAAGMAAGISAMHYVGMAGLRVYPHEHITALEGTPPADFMVLVMMFVASALLMVLYMVLTGPAQPPARKPAHAEPVPEPAGASR